MKYTRENRERDNAYAEQFVEAMGGGPHAEDQFMILVELRGGRVRP